MARRLDDDELLSYTKLALSVMNDLKRIGLPMYKVSRLEYNPRLKNVIARCRILGKMVGGELTDIEKIWIEISESFTYFSTEEQRNIFAHEFIHACGALGHGAKLKYYMNIVNRHGYNVTTTADELPEDLYKYVITCPKCGRHWGFHRMCPTVEQYRDCLCPQCHCSVIRER